MLIELKKFGDALSSRPAGREAYLALQPLLRDLKEEEKIEIGFDGVGVLGPSWADEFITPLQQKFGDRVVLHSSNNSSVKATIEFLASIQRGDWNSASSG